MSGKPHKSPSAPRPSRRGGSRSTLSNNFSLEEKQMTSMPLGQRQTIEGLTVVGEATRDPLPDIIELGFDIHAAGFSAALAVQEIATKVNQIGQGLARVADGQVKLQSGGVAVWPLLQPPNPQFMPITTPPLLPASGLHTGSIVSMAAPDIPQPFGYTAIGSIKIAVQESARLGEIVDTVTAAGAVPNGSIRFLIRDEAALRRTLLEDAVNEAREKAKILAAGFGKTPGNPISISEEFVAYQSPQEIVRTSASAARAPMPGALVFCTRVNVTYQLQ